MPDVFAVIMAGGRGERFWPRSRVDTPKQLLEFFGEGSLIEQTAARLKGLVPDERIFIITNRRYVERIRKQLPQLPAENIVGEPCPRDTAPCVALAAGIVRAKAGEGANPVMILLPADHYIGDGKALRHDFALAAGLAAREEAIVTIGIPPTGPSPDYGYIESAPEGTGPFRRVSRFLEKPTVEVAEQLLAKGNYRWNSGMFIFSSATIRRELGAHAPDLLELSDRLAAAWSSGNFTAELEREFQTARKISIDYAVMEHAREIRMLEASFDWDDIGNWSSLRNHLPPDEAGNVVRAEAELIGCRDCVVFSDQPGHLVAGIGLEGMVVVHTADATLVVPAARTAEIKELLKRISAREGGERHL